MIIGDNWGTVKYYRNDGDVRTPIWVRYDALFTGVEVDQGPHPGFADLDDDGRKDMILGEYNGNFTYYKNLFSPLTDIESENSLTTPNEFVLCQNYPNPFNPSTKISWQSSVAGWQTLKVYDVLGKEVVTLVDEEKPAGRYEVQFNASNLSSGVYIYTLKVNGVAYSKNMILLR